MDIETLLRKKLLGTRKSTSKDGEEEFKISAVKKFKQQTKRIVEANKGKITAVIDRPK